MDPFGPSANTGVGEALFLRAGPQANASTLPINKAVPSLMLPKEKVKIPLAGGTK